jgi:rsbT co-antagonist protein RsbR
MSDKQDFSDLTRRVGEVLLVLSDVAAGVYETRCSADLPVTHPLGALFIGVNEMIDVLQAESVQRERYQHELEEKLATIQNQSVVIRRLSTPIIEVWDGVLCVMVMGLFDEARSTTFVADLLVAVATKNARCVIVDVTGTECLDAATVELFVKLFKAVRLLGAGCALTGITPAVAITLVATNSNLDNVRSYQTLRDALKAVM